MQAHFTRRVGSLCRSARADTQPALQAPAKSAAQSQSRSGLQHHLVFAVVLGFQALDPLEVDDRRTMDAAELLRVELALELDEAAAQHVCSRADVKACVIVGGLDPVDVCDLDEQHLAPVLDDKAAGDWRAR